MALTIGDGSMSSDRSVHTARLLPGARYTWVVSWLPGRHLDHGKAAAAMTIADITADGDSAPGPRERADIRNCAAALNLTSADALRRVAAPPQWDTHPASVLEFGEHNGTRAVLEDPDPIDLGIDEYLDDLPYPGSPDFDRFADDPIDLTWTGKEPPGFPLPPPESEALDATGPGQADSALWRHVPQQRGAGYIPLQSAFRRGDRTLHQPVNPAEADRSSLPGREPGKQAQPAQERDIEPDWEAGE